MKRINVDLIVGASILAALFILVAGLLWLKEVSLADKQVNYMVVFPEVGTLQVGDPVYANGVKKGTVRRIELRGTEVVTVLNLDKDVHFTDSARVAVVNVGLLGERGIGITLSSLGRRVVPVDADTKDTMWVRGQFDTGIAEAMGMLGAMLAEVETLIVSVGDILGATVGDTTFIAQFHDIVGRVDTITIATNRLLRRNEPVLNAAMTNLRTVSSDLKELIDRNRPGLDSIVDGGNVLLARGIALIEQADTLVADVKGVLRHIEDGKGTLGKLYVDDAFYNELKTVVASVDSLISEIQEDALKLRVRLGFGRKRNK